MSTDPLLTWNGRKVRSPNDTPATIAAKVPEVPLKQGTLFFIPSPLDGWGIDVLLERLPDDGAVVVFEKDRELAQVCEPRFQASLGERASDPRLFSLAEDTEQAIQLLFDRLPLQRLRRCHFLTLNGAWLAHSHRYREVYDRIQRGLNQWWANRLTCIHLGALWVKNLFDNLRSDRFPGSPWPDWATDTVVVCGAGVTLDSIVPWIADHRHQIRVLAADTSLPTLQASGIIPDAVVSLEAQHANLRDFAGYTGSPIPLFADLNSFPSVTRIFTQPTHWFVTEFDRLELWNRSPWFQTVPRMPPLGSVGVAAAWIAWKLTRGQVLLAGLDFSFPPGRTHARQAPALQNLLDRSTRLSPVEQVGTWVRPGNQLLDRGWLTTPVLSRYAGVLKDQASHHADRTFVWSTEGIPLELRLWDRGVTPPELALPLNPDPSKDESHRVWLSEEQHRCQHLWSQLEHINLPGLSESLWSELKPRIQELDYLTFSFPDPEPRNDPAWLIRFTMQLRWHLDRF